MKTLKLIKWVFCAALLNMCVEYPCFRMCSVFAATRAMLLLWIITALWVNTEVGLVLYWFLSEELLSVIHFQCFRGFFSFLKYHWINNQNYGKLIYFNQNPEGFEHINALMFSSWEDSNMLWKKSWKPSLGLGNRWPCLVCCAYL